MFNQDEHEVTVKCQLNAPLFLPEVYGPIININCNEKRNGREVKPQEMIIEQKLRES